MSKFVLETDSKQIPGEYLCADDAFDAAERMISASDYYMDHIRVFSYPDIGAPRYYGFVSYSEENGIYIHKSDLFF